MKEEYQTLLIQFLTSLLSSKQWAQALPLQFLIALLNAKQWPSKCNKNCSGMIAQSKTSLAEVSLQVKLVSQAASGRWGSSCSPWGTPFLTKALFLAVAPSYQETALLGPYLTWGYLPLLGFSFNCCLQNWFDLYRPLGLRAVCLGKLPARLTLSKSTCREGWTKHISISVMDLPKLITLSSLYCTFIFRH